MLIRAKGGMDGIVEYLLHGQMKDRFYSRDELDTRVVLSGNLDMIDNAIHSYKNDGGEKYFHITLAFKEDNLSEDVLKNIADEFRGFYFNAYEDDELSFYAEAHLPKIKSYHDNKTDEIIERKPHIHVVVPKVNLLTGGSLDTKEKFNIKYVDAFQEYVNCKYGLASPKDNRRTDFNDKSEMIARYKGDVFNGLGKEIKEQVLETILTNNPTNFKELISFLKKDGFEVRIRNFEKENEYLNVKSTDSNKGTNLKDYVFSEEFLGLTFEKKIEFLNTKTQTTNLTREDKISIIERAKFGNDYVEANKIIQQVPQKYMDLLAEWNDVVCYQRKYIDRMSGGAERNHFKNLSKEDQLEFLKQKKQEFYIKYRGDKNGLTKSERDQLGDVYRKTAFDNLQSAENDSRKLSENVERSGRNKISPITSERRRAIRNEYARLIGVSKRGHDNDKVGGEYDKEQNRRYTTIDSITKDYINEEITTGAFKSEFDYFKKILRADVLLEMLEKSHGVIPEKYKITISKDGTDRIGCGERNYSVVDFCLKELHVDWVDTAKILRASELMQSAVDREQGWSVHQSQYLRDEYTIWVAEYKKAKDIELAALGAEAKERWNAIKTEFAKKIEGINKSDIGYHKKVELKRLLKMERIVENRALSAGRNKDLLAIREKYNLSMQEAYRKFLVEKSELGDERALLELKRLRIDFEEFKTSGTIKYVDRYNDFRLNVTHKIDMNGVITYSLNDMQILKDSGKRIDILKDSKDNLKLALDLSISKFGMSLELHGTENFRRKLVELSIKENYKVTFKDGFSETYRRDLIKQMKASHLELELSNKEALNTLSEKKANLLVVDSRIVETIDENGKYKEVYQISLIDLESKQEFKVNGPSVRYLLGSERLSVGNVVALTTEQERIKIDPYYWSKYTTDIKRGVVIKEFITDNKIKIKMPDWLQKKYHEESFIIECPNLTDKLQSIGYQAGDLISVETSLNKETRQINYEFVLLGESKEKADIKKELLAEDIKHAQQKFYINDVSEISGTIVEAKIRRNMETNSEIGVIVVSNDDVHIHADVMALKVKLCKENQVSLYDLEKEVAGKICNLEFVDYKGKDIFCMSIDTNNGVKKLYGQGVYDIAWEQKLKIGDNVYIAGAGKQGFKQIDGSIDLKNEYTYNRFVALKLNEQQLKNIDDFTKVKFKKYKKEGYVDLINSKDIKVGENVTILKDGVKTIKDKVAKKDVVIASFDIEKLNNDMDKMHREFEIKYPSSVFNVAGDVVIGEIQNIGNQTITENIKVPYVGLITASGNKVDLYGDDTKFVNKAKKILGARVVADTMVEKQRFSEMHCLNISNYHDGTVDSHKSELCFMHKNIDEIDGKVVGMKQTGNEDGANKYEVFEFEETNKTITDTRNQIMKQYNLEDAGFKGIVGQLTDYAVDEQGKAFVEITTLDGQTIKYACDNVYAMDGYDVGDYIYLTEVYYDEKITREVDNYKAYKPDELKQKLQSDMQINVSKEICGKVVDFGTGYKNKEKSYFIVLEDNKYRIKSEVLELKKEFCRKNEMALYGLDKEVCGEIVTFGSAKFDESKEDGRVSYYIDIKLQAGVKRVWGNDLERLMEEQSLFIGDNIYLAKVGYTRIQSPNDKYEKSMNRFDCIKLNKEQMEHQREFTKSIYTRYWNTGFCDLIKENKIIKNEPLYIAKVGGIKEKLIDKKTNEIKEVVRDRFDVAKVGANIDRRAVTKIKEQQQILAQNELER
ncbi:MAG: relaxase/mobilization nuclease domain-containing protein [Burkholderiales bacterium]|nr:relaxase/mobilization nuclease domain-containing protein [Burkholderiales bacterium]